jgi:ribose transport system substrate-binding protein
MVVLIVVALMFSLVACSNTPEPVAEEPAAAEESVEEAPAEEPAGPVDYANFRIDPSQIPQEKLDTTLYVGASVRGLTNPYIVTIIDGMDMFCEYLDSIGQKYEKQTLDSGGSNDKEVDNMKQFAAKANGNAIAYSDPNESAIAPALAEAMAESGGYIGTAWNKPEDYGPEDYNPNWVIHTSPDNVIGGYNIAAALTEAMGGSGGIFVVEGMLGNTAASDRRKGLDMFLAENPQVTVLNEDTANWDTKEALALTETWLNTSGEVTGIWCANDNMATGALQALDKAGLKGKIPVVGIDGTTDMVQAIADGYATATVSSNGYLQGGYTLAICYAAWAGLIDPTEMPSEYREFATPSQLVTSENVEEFMGATPEFDFEDLFYCRVE